MHNYIFTYITYCVYYNSIYAIYNKTIFSIDNSKKNYPLY